MYLSLNHLVVSKLLSKDLTLRPLLNKDQIKIRLKGQDFTLLSLGLMLLYKKDSDTHQSVGQRYMNSMKVIKDALLIALMNGLIAWAKIELILILSVFLGML
jgi:hypothetical protein